MRSVKEAQYLSTSYSLNRQILIKSRASYAIFKKQTSLDDLQKLARQQNHDDKLSRSHLWKTFLLFETLDQNAWSAKLRSSRDAFTSLRTHFLRSIEHPDELVSAADPLTENSNSPWAVLRKDEELRQEILLDVDRCMPDNYYFRQPDSQKLLLDILFLWSKLNMDVGYRQGMHEVLAPVLWVVERDAIDPDSLQATSGDSTDDLGPIKELFDAEYIGHDTFTLFSLIMQQAKSSYEHIPPTNRRQTRNDSETDTPMITRSKVIIDDYLAKVDQQLSLHLRNIDLAPQLFLIRWIRLLFGREFPFDQLLRLWDGLFMAANTLECIDLVCTAMLLRIRWQLIEADYNTALGLLLHYAVPSTDSDALTFLNDALYLRENLNHQGGSHIVKKYTGRSLLVSGISQYETRESTSTSRPATRIRPALNPTGQVLPQFAGFEALLQDAARGVYTRGEKWGLNKAMRDAVGEVRKNMQGLHSRSHSRTESSDETAEERLRLKVETLQKRNKTLSRMLESAVSDLWQQQNDMAAATSDDSSQVKAFTVATAKVQLVQAYLNDSTLPLPPEDGIEDSGRQHATLATKETAKPLQRKPTRVDSESSSNEDKISTSSIENISQERQSKRLFTEPETAASGYVNSLSLPKKAENPVTPEKSKLRRHLAQSDFSWMLGQDSASTPETPRSTFVSASPFSMPDDGIPAGRRGKNSGKATNAFLFGEDDNTFEGGSHRETEHTEDHSFDISLSKLVGQK